MEQTVLIGMHNVAVVLWLRLIRNILYFDVLFFHAVISRYSCCYCY